MMDKFFQLRPGEQVSILALSCLLLAALAWFLVWQPLNFTLDREEQRFAESLETRDTVGDLVRQIASFQESASNAETGSVGSLTSLVNDSLQERRLQLAGMQQLSADQVQIRLDNVAFGQALAWIYDLESLPGLVVGEVSLRPAQPAGAGLVSLTVGLGRTE